MPLDRGLIRRYVEHAGNTLGATIVHAMWRDAIEHGRCAVQRHVGLARRLPFFDEVATHLLASGLEPGELADLILASSDDWTPDPCPTFRAQCARAPRKLLLDYLKKRQRAYRARISSTGASILANDSPARRR